MVATLSLDGHEAEWESALRRVNAGEEVVLTEHGRPVARIVRIEEPVRVLRRRGGQDAGRIRMSDDFDELPEDLLDAFES